MAYNVCVDSAIILIFFVVSVQSYTLYPNWSIDFSNDRLVLLDIKRTASSKSANDFSTYCIDTCANTCSPYRYTTIMAVAFIINNRDREYNHEDYHKDDDDMDSNKR